MTARSEARIRRARRLRTLIPAALLFLLVLVVWQIAVVLLEVPEVHHPQPHRDRR